MTPVKERKTVGKVVGSLKLLLSVICIVPFVLFALWLLRLVYFPRSEVERVPVVSESTKEEDIFKEIVTQKEPVSRSHFHMIDEYVSQPEPNPPVCLTCHGTYPHSKLEKVRSLLNFHTGFIACSVCHVRKGPGEDAFSFAWVDRETGVITMTLQGGYGKYQAKIFPTRISDKGSKEIFRPVSLKAARQFLQLKDKFTPDQVAQAKVKLHEGISGKPVYCPDCHKKDGYVDFAELGFPEKRVNHLISTEVASMIDKYDTFYLPSVITFEK